MKRSAISLVLLLFLAFPIGSHALPVLEVGIGDGTGFAPYVAATSTPYGSDKDTAQTSANPFSLALGGAYKQNDIVNLGGAFSTTVDGHTYNFDWNSSEIGLGFLSGAKGAVLMATVLEGETGSITFSPASGLYGAPTFKAARTGDDDSGFPNNHFPVGLNKTFDFLYFDLGTAFSKMHDGVVNFAAPSDKGDGEIRYFTTTIIGYSFVHFDLLAIEIEKDVVTGCKAKWYTTLDEDLVNNPGSKDVTYSGHPVPEPGTIMLLGSGLVGLIGFGRKRFRM